jgi:plasmid replication initiation protein
MISYNPHRIDRALLARACDYLVDGLYNQLSCTRQELIDTVDRDHIEEAVYLLEASLPAEYHRRIDERDIAITAVALVLYRVEDWYSILDQFLTELADELGFFPERC